MTADVIALRHALSELREDDRELLLLATWEGLSPLQYDGSDEYTALWQADERVLEFRTQAASVDEFARLIDALVVVDVDSWLSAMPASVIKAADQPAVISDMLTGIALPDSFDPNNLADYAGIKDRYQLAARVVAAVSCAWIEQWLDATESGDAMAAQETTDAMDNRAPTAKSFRPRSTRCTTGGGPYHRTNQHSPTATATHSAARNRSRSAPVRRDLGRPLEGLPATSPQDRRRHLRLFSRKCWSGACWVTAIDRSMTAVFHCGGHVVGTKPRRGHATPLEGARLTRPLEVFPVDVREVRQRASEAGGYDGCLVCRDHGECLPNSGRVDREYRA